MLKRNWHYGRLLLNGHQFYQWAKKEEHNMRKNERGGDLKPAIITTLPSLEQEFFWSRYLLDSYAI